jgi:hypothetical protein
VLTQCATHCREHCIPQSGFWPRRPGLQTQNEFTLCTLPFLQLVKGVAVVVVKYGLPFFAYAECVGMLELLSCQRASS